MSSHTRRDLRRPAFSGCHSARLAAGDVALVLAKPVPFVGIVQGRDGRPIAGARARIRYMRGSGGKNDHNPVLENVLQGTPLEALFVAITDAQGGFRFPAVPAPQGVVLNVSAEGMADLSTEVRGDYAAGFISGTEAKPARLTMEAEARVMGRIVTKLPGVSVAGLKIGLQSTNDSTMFWRDVRTDAEGRFEMRGLPEGGGNLFPIDHPSDGPWAYRAIDNLALHPGKTSEVTIELIEGVLVEGKVAEATTGKPIVGVGVGMYGPARPQSGAAIMSATTNDQGKYQFRLPVGGTYFYICSDSELGGSQSVVIPAGAKTFTVPTIEVRTRAARARAEMAPKAAQAPQNKEMEKVTLSGFACDVSDGPAGGALIVGAILRGDVASTRAIVQADERTAGSRSSLRDRTIRSGGCDLRLERRPFSGLRQHEASHGDTRCKSETGPCANETVCGERAGSTSSSRSSGRTCAFKA